MNHRKKVKRAVAVVATVALMLCGIGVGSPDAQAAKKKAAISKKKLTLTVGQTKKLKVKNISAKKKITWSSNKKKVASVSSKGVVRAKKAGTATVTAKVGKKKFTCKVTVKNKKPSLPEATITPVSTPTPTPVPVAPQTTDAANSATPPTPPTPPTPSSPSCAVKNESDVATLKALISQQQALGGNGKRRH